MTDEETVKEKLRRLAAGAGDGGQDQHRRRPDSLDAEHRRTIERATAALDDLEAATQFVENGGLSELERAVEAAARSVSACAERGQETLAEYRRFRAAASGEQFHSGRGTSLGDGDKAQIR